MCPAGPFTGSPIPSGAKATAISGAPPNDSFNMNGFGNVEGPVWIGDSLYFSEMKDGNNIPAARILKVGPGDAVSVFITDSGSNGLAVDGSGNILAASHGVGGIVRFAMPSKTPTTLASMYMGERFDSPNDLTVKSDGTIYFTDPDYQNSGGKQSAQRVYQVPPGGSPTVITDYTSEPNGITLSLDEKFLFVAGQQGVKKYAINNGQVEMTGTKFGTISQNVDGMTMDCAGNLYLAVGSSTNVVVLDPSGNAVQGSPIQVPGPTAVTNVAFGGTDHKTLYVTGQGNPGQRGVYKVNLNFPGMPY